jgi:hypothetical protein
MAGTSVPVPDSLDGAFQPPHRRQGVETSPTRRDCNRSGVPSRELDNVSCPEDQSGLPPLIRRPSVACDAGPPAPAWREPDNQRRQLRLDLPSCHRDPGTLSEIVLDPRRNRTGDHWHIRVDGLPEEFCYGYRVAGPSGDGHRYDPNLVLLDPASRALSCGRPWAIKGNEPAIQGWSIAISISR